MDPVSLAGACLMITVRGASIVKDLSVLRERYKEVGHSIDLLISQVSILEICTNRLSVWLDGCPSQLSEDERLKLSRSLKLCETLLNRIQEHVNAVKGGSKEINVKGKGKHLWDERSVTGYQRNLEGHIQTLNFFINIFSQLPSLADKEATFDIDDANVIARKARDDTTSLLQLGGTEINRSSISLASNATARSRFSKFDVRFSFDGQIFSSRPYRNAFESWIKQVSRVAEVDGGQCTHVAVSVGNARTKDTERLNELGNGNDSTGSTTSFFTAEEIQNPPSPEVAEVPATSSSNPPACVRTTTTFLTAEEYQNAPPLEVADVPATPSSNPPVNIRTSRRLTRQEQIGSIIRRIQTRVLFQRLGAHLEARLWSRHSDTAIRRQLLLDTGSGVNAMSVHVFADLSNAYLEDSDGHVLATIGGTLLSLGRVRVNISFRGYSKVYKEIWFYVVDITSFDALVGLPFLRENLLNKGY